MLPGISRLPVALHHWSCVLSGWKLTAELSPQAGPGPKHASYPSPSRAALLQTLTYITYYSLLASSLPCIAEPCWHNQGGHLWVVFCYSDVDSFTRNVRKLIYPSRHTEFKGKGHLGYVLTAQWGARHINSTELKTSTCNPEWIG